MDTVEIYTDGSCFPNPGGPGGWAAVIIDKSGEVEICGSATSTTNNRMELIAVICALESLASKSSFEKPLEVMIYSDSMYVVNPIQRQKVRSWSAQANRKNRDLWERLFRSMVTMKVKAKWVRGHAGHPQNERCDGLAESQRMLVPGAPRQRVGA